MKHRSPSEKLPSRVAGEDASAPWKDRPPSGTLLSRRFRMVLLHLAEEARRDLDSLPAKPIRSIHSLRTRMKNLRAILQLVKERVPKASRKAIMASIKSLKSEYAAERDAHVITTLRTEIEGRRHAAPAAKGATRKVMVSKLLLAEAVRLARLLSRLRLDGLAWDDILSAYQSCYRDGRRAMNACLRDSDPELLHRWRQPVKDLFYQSRVLQPLKGMERRVRLAQRLGDRLGKLHDVRLLADHARGAAGRGITKRIAKKRKALKPVIFKTAEKLFSEKPREVAKELEHCVRMLPAVAALSARQA